MPPEPGGRSYSRLLFTHFATLQLGHPKNDCVNFFVRYRLTVKDADGETDSTTATVTVNAGKLYILEFKRMNGHENCLSLSIDAHVC